MLARWSPPSKANCRTHNSPLTKSGLVDSM
jgi:hypothetical protein